MDFTREPIIETIITPKEGCKLVVRSSKATGQEEYFVDSIEVVVFGNAIFFRSLERPKAFVVPASDYEILEIREAKVVLKNVGIEKSIKIGTKQPKEIVSERSEPISAPSSSLTSSQESETSTAEKTDAKADRKRDRRRHTRRRRGASAEGDTELSDQSSKEQEIAAPHLEASQEEGASLAAPTPAPKPKPILPPPDTLISETIARYRDNALFQGAFYLKKDEPIETETVNPGFNDDSMVHFRPQDDLMDPLDLQNVVLEPPEFGSFGTFEEELPIDAEHEVSSENPNNANNE